MPGNRTFLEVASMVIIWWTVTGVPLCKTQIAPVYCTIVLSHLHRFDTFTINQANIAVYT